MQLYKATIKPISAFATTLKGDTLFGQLCWAVHFTLGEDRLKELLQEYETNPFLIVSDGFSSGYLPKPTMPSSLLNENIDTKKQNRKNIWLTFEELIAGKFNQARSNEAINSQEKSTVIVRNSLNYQTSHTGDGDGFDPYSNEEFSLDKKDIYFLIDDRLTKDELQKLIAFLGQYGYGKKSTIGKGRFELESLKPVNININAKRFMSLSPFTPYKLECSNIYYEPFTRFGKSGANRASTNAFKKPIVLANTAAVIEYEDKKSLQYIGSAIKNISTYQDIVHQGYSIVLAIGEKENDENI